MDQYSFERPRERLQRTGAASLTTVELLQVLIASGNSKASSARIAKYVLSLLESTNGTPSFDALLRIAGLGVAKSCQILAAIELSLRITSPQVYHHPVANPSRLQKATKMTLLCTFIDGSGAAVGEYFKPVGKSPAYSIDVKHMFGEALARNARSIEVLLGERHQDIHILSTSTLSILQKVYDTAALLQMSATVYLVNKADVRHIKRKALYG